jgi:hypothetical protein
MLRLLPYSLGPQITFTIFLFKASLLRVAFTAFFIAFYC